MKRSLMVCTLFIIALSLLATPVLAEREAVARSLDPTVMPQQVGQVRPVTTCEVGNLNTPVWAIADWLMPQDRYALIFDPAATCQECPLGFRVTMIHVMVQTAADCELTMRAVLMTVESDGDPDCFVPGNAYCGGPDFQISIPAAGLWDIALPVNCACADSDYPFALKVVFAALSCTDGSVPDLVTDDFPAVCISYNDVGAGWQDLVADYGFPGNLMIWADAECCADPVEAESKTWGGLKDLYR